MRRTKIPVTGPGPRGVPDCWHRPRVLLSTKRYENYIKKLRKAEEFASTNAETTLLYKTLLAKNAFIIKSAEKGKFNDMMRRAEGRMKSYHKQLDEKRDKMRKIFQQEEQENITLLVEKAQEGAQLVEQEKRSRLAYLKAKRQKEIDDVLSEPPLSKCPHVTEKLFDLRCRDSKIVQKYQMQEKQMMKDQIKEWEQLWHEEMMRFDQEKVAELDREALERAQRTKECDEYNRLQEQLKLQQKEEELKLMERGLSENQKIVQAALEAEAEELKKHLAKKEIEKQDLLESLSDSIQRKAKEKDDEKNMNDLYKHLMTTQFDQDNYDAELNQRKALDSRDANDKLIYLKTCYAAKEKGEEELYKEVAESDFKKHEASTCAYTRWQRRLHDEAAQGVRAQIEENRAKAGDKDQIRAMGRAMVLMEIEKQKDEDRKAEIFKQNKKDMYKRELMAQIEGNRRRRETEEENRDKDFENYLRSERDYDEMMNKMILRPFHSDKIHGFTSSLYNRMPQNCPCDKLKQ